MATIDGDGDSDINYNNGDEYNEIKIVTIQKLEKSSKRYAVPARSRIRRVRTFRV